jgi:hypothetical protein
MGRQKSCKSTARRAIEKVLKTILGCRALCPVQRTGYDFPSTEEWLFCPPLFGWSERRLCVLLFSPHSAHEWSMADRIVRIRNLDVSNVAAAGTGVEKLAGGR